MIATISTSFTWGLGHIRLVMHMHMHTVAGMISLVLKADGWSSNRGPSIENGGPPYEWDFSLRHHNPNKLSVVPYSSKSKTNHFLQALAYKIKTLGTSDDRVLSSLLANVTCLSMKFPTSPLAGLNIGATISLHNSVHIVKDLHKILRWIFHYVDCCVWNTNKPREMGHHCYRVWFLVCIWKPT